MANTALLPVPFQQFFDANGVVLAAGKLLSFAAGTTTPLATYQDANGATPNTNPVILDSAGRANVWLLGQAYKIVLQDSAGVQIWSQDNVSSVSIAELLGIISFASISVTGDAEIGGDLTVDGKITAASGEFTGELAVDGNLTAASESVTGNFSVGGDTSLTGDLAVGGDETVAGTLTASGDVVLPTAADITVGGVLLATYIASLIPAITELDGTLVAQETTSGGFLVLTFGSTAGTRLKVAIGFGAGLATGASIPIPGAFNTTNMIAGAWISNVSATSGNQLDNMAVSVSGGVVTVTASDNSGHNFTPTAGWAAVCWLTNQ